MKSVDKWLIEHQLADCELQKSRLLEIASGVDSVKIDGHHKIGEGPDASME
jgi:hypothetical protein